MKDLTGMRFRMLTVVSKAHTNRHVHWRCRCDCGNYTVVASNHLQKPNGTVSCGCVRSTHKQSRAGAPQHPLYRVWLSMRERCNNPKCKGYPNYGGRGITVCPEWDSFERFLADMGNRPPGRQLDRIDNAGPYSKDNCRWATAFEQAQNTRVTRHIEFNGERRCLSDWARHLGIPTSTLHAWCRKYGEQDALARAMRRGG